jgi:hypothetical protein
MLERLSIGTLIFPILMDTLLFLECINCSCECLGESNFYFPLLASTYRESNLYLYLCNLFPHLFCTILTFSCRDDFPLQEMTLWCNGLTRKCKSDNNIYLKSWIFGIHGKEGPYNANSICRLCLFIDVWLVCWELIVRIIFFMDIEAYKILAPPT